MDGRITAPSMRLGRAARDAKAITVARTELNPSNHSETLERFGLARNRVF